jgi:hypothetical protein
VTSGGGEKAPARLEAHREAGGVVRARLAIEQLGRVALQQPLEDVRPRAGGIALHREQAGAEGAEDLHRPRIRGLLDGDHVAGVDQRARDEIEALLRAVDDEDLLRACLDTESQEVGRQVLAQRRISAHGVVLQEDVALVTDDIVQHASEGVGGKEAAVRHPACERDDPLARCGRIGAPLGVDDARASRQQLRPRYRRRMRPRPTVATVACARGEGREPAIPGGAAVRALGNEGPLAHVSARPPGGDQLLVREGDRGAVDAERLGQLAGGGQLDARREQALADEALEVRLDLPRQRHRPVAIERNVHWWPRPAILGFQSSQSSANWHGRRPSNHRPV